MPLAEALSELPDVRVETVPSAFSPQHFLRVWPRERRRLKALVAEADYLSFAIGGLFGDWGQSVRWKRCVCANALPSGRIVSDPTCCSNPANGVIGNSA